MANNKLSNDKLLVTDVRQKITFSIVESYKNIRTNILTFAAKSGAKTFAFSSPNASEGKSTTALNIAITISQLEKKVLVIDADTHRPSLHKKLKIENNFGLLNIIVDNTKINEAIYNHTPFLDIITAGTNTANPSELLLSEKFDELLEELKEQYDYIIVDAPPINPVSDALVIAQKVDSVVLIVRAATTTHEAFRKAVKSLNMLDITVDGVVINGSDPRPKGYYKSKYSYYKNAKTYY